MPVSAPRPWLTADAHARLTAELADLQREPDDGASEQDRLDRRQHRQARIRQLQELVQDAVIGEDPPDDGIAEPGMVLTVRYEDGGGTETFLLGSRDEAGDVAVCSPDSPLGQALDGAKPGEEREYEVPSGAVVRVTLVAAHPYGRFRSRS
ncbi:GreA/GreB family elongation factor [Amycolatopsis benzoatilytica]|uniref:GreA/GreB family elongation factor n=1 Tax=Amycolatopsis benzoatilytica TaxID=346045 RepID=UPI00036BDBBB|nr:GreA/GreB family elongation factor [Amycolatopsis benzoatilytica]